MNSGYQGYSVSGPGSGGGGYGNSGYGGNNNGGYGNTSYTNTGTTYSANNSYSTNNSHSANNYSANNNNNPLFTRNLSTHHNAGYAGAGYGGGGFAGSGDADDDGPGPDSGGFLESASQEHQNRDRPVSRDTIHPLNLAQVIEATPAGDEDTYSIDGVDVRNISIVALVNTVQVQTTKVVFLLDDGTGMIEAHKWIDSEDSEDLEFAALFPVHNPLYPTGVQQSYVRIFGKIKDQPNRRVIAVTSIRQLPDSNEVFSHIHDVIVHHLYSTEGPVEDVLANRQAAIDQADGRLQALSLPAKEVFMSIRKANNPAGVHYNDLARQHFLSEGEIRRVGEELFNSGLVYTPMDDDSWAELDAM